jgi:hypothetical protein
MTPSDRRQADISLTLCVPIKCRIAPKAGPLAGPREVLGNGRRAYYQQIGRPQELQTKKPGGGQRKPTDSLSMAMGASDATAALKHSFICICPTLQK